MANILRIKRRASGNAGAPTSLQNAELAFNEIDDTLYYGKGTGGAGGTATTVEAIGGKGSFVALTGDQTIGGIKTFSSTISGSIDGNAATATKLATSRTISLSTDATGSASFDGSANATIAVTLANSGVTAGTYGSASAIPAITVDAKGRVTSVSTNSISTSLSLAGDTGTDTVTLGTDTLSVLGGEGIDVAVTNNTITVSAEDATSSNKGVASFGADFTVTTGAVALANKGTAGTYTKVTTDAKGQVTSGTTLSATDIPTLTAAKISDFDTQVRTSRLDQMAAPTAAVSLNSQRITGLADPTSAQDAATKNYVDLAVQGLDPKQSVKAASTTNIASLSGTTTIDGVALVAGDRILVKDQSTPSQNGVYVVAAGAWSRADDMSTWDEHRSAFLFVEQGTVNAENGFLCTVDAGGTLGTTAITFVQFSGAGQITAGAGLTKTGNTIDIVTASSARIVVNADSIDLATVGTAGTYRSVTTDAYGRVTAGTNPTTLSGYGITDAQPLDATLTALAGVTTSANTVIYATGADTFTTTSLTAFGRSLIDDADAATARTTLGLGTIATQAASNVAITGGSITNLTTFDGITIDGGTF